MPCKTDLPLSGARVVEWALDLCALACLLAAAGGAAAAEPLAIRQGWVSLTAAFTPIVFEHKEVMRHYGTSYVLEASHFQGTSAELTAIAAGEADLITIGFSTLAAGVERAGLDLRIVADGFQDGIEGHFSSHYVVRADSGIDRIEDLKGKALATNGIGGSLDVALRAMMRKHGMEDKHDYTLIESEFATMNAMLLSGKVDLIGQTPPFIYDPALTAKSRLLFTMRDAVGPTQMIALAARAQFLDKNRAAMTDFFEDYLRGIRWALDPAHRAEVVALVAGATKQPAERIASFLYTDRDFYRDAHARPNLDALQHDMETQVSLGFVKSELDVRKYSDLSFIEAAAQRVSDDGH
jgi:sulfonate transport system substrate-binding protein